MAPSIDFSSCSNWNAWCVPKATMIAVFIVGVTLRDTMNKCVFRKMQRIFTQFISLMDPQITYKITWWLTRRWEYNYNMLFLRCDWFILLLMLFLFVQWCEGEYNSNCGCRCVNCHRRRNGNSDSILEETIGAYWGTKTKNTGSIEWLGTARTRGIKSINLSTL